VANLITQHHFTDFELFAETIRGYDFDVKQIEPGLFTVFSQQVISGSVTITRFTSSLRIEVNGSPPPDIRTFGIPTRRCEPFVWRNRQSPANTIQIYNPSTELAVMTGKKFEAMDVSISESNLNALNRQWGFPELASIIGNREMITCDPVKMKGLRQTLDYVCTSLGRQPNRLQQDVALQNAIRYQVPYHLVDALMTSTSLKIKHAAQSRDRAIKATIEYIQASPDKALTIEAICHSTGIHKRTLQRTFMDMYGVTPKYYLQVHRLNNVYKKLQKSRPETTKITDVALDQGYWHMSQFAADYRRLFGELPSTTLSRSR
jgi:AraC family ethanolamine operon transcriptional activator